MYSTVFAFTLQAYLWKNLVLLLFWSSFVNQHNVNKRQCDSGWHFWNQTEITYGGLKDVNSKRNYRPELDPKETWIQVYHILHMTMWKQTVLNPLLLVQLQFLSIEKKKKGGLCSTCAHIQRYLKRDAVQVLVHVRQSQYNTKWIWVTPLKQNQISYFGVVTLEVDLKHNPVQVNMVPNQTEITSDKRSQSNGNTKNWIRKRPMSRFRSQCECKLVKSFEQRTGEKGDFFWGSHSKCQSLVVGHFIQYKTRQGSASFELCVHTGQANQLETKSWADLNCVSTRVLWNCCVIIFEFIWLILQWSIPQPLKLYTNH